MQEPVVQAAHFSGRQRVINLYWLSTCNHSSQLVIDFKQRLLAWHKALKTITFTALGHPQFIDKILPKWLWQN